MKVIFLDRDGVINRERGDYTFHLSDFEILPEAIDVLKIWRDKGYRFIIVTNQGGIAKGLYDHLDFGRLDDYLKAKFAEKGVELMDTFYCPHHPEVGKCLCRKPQSLLLEKAMAKYNIDRTSSYLIGDQERDIEAGEKVGLHTFLIAPNTSLRAVVHLVQ